MSSAVVVFALNPGEWVCCYFCLQERERRVYGRGEAFLAGAAHSPCDGNANYVCREHLDPNVEICDPWNRREL